MIFPRWAVIGQLREYILACLILGHAIIGGDFGSKGKITLGDWRELLLKAQYWDGLFGLGLLSGLISLCWVWIATARC